jgi:hypothetical protein
MKARLGVLLLLFAAPLAFAGVVSDIPLASQVLLKGDSKWVPTQPQRQQALHAIQGFLETIDRGKRVPGASAAETSFLLPEIRKLLANSAGYRVQFKGIKENGDRIILCNFFPAAPNQGVDEFESWRQTEVQVSDGGFYFWTIEYNPLNRVVSKLYIHGYALQRITPEIQGSEFARAVKILIIKPSALGDIVQALPVPADLDLRGGKIILPI